MHASLEVAATRCKKKKKTAAAAVFITAEHFLSKKKKEVQVFSKVLSYVTCFYLLSNRARSWGQANMQDKLSQESRPESSLKSDF